MGDAPSVPATIDAEPFGSMIELRKVHGELRGSLLAFKGAPSTTTFRPSAATIRSFVAQARATGAIIRDDDERRAAQGILDYWSTELVSMPDATSADFTPAMLAPRDELTLEREQMSHAETSTVSAASSKPLDNQSRELIRLSAAARLWRDSGKKDAYLIWGETEIDRAARFRRLDPDIDDLVAASERAATRYGRRLYASSGMVIVVLSGLLIAVWSYWKDEEKQTIRLSHEKKELTDQSKELSVALDETKTALANSRKSAEAADVIERRLDASLALLRKLLREGVLERAQLPPDLAPLLAEAPPPSASPSPPPVQLVADSTGYDADFVGTTIALPGPIAGRQREDYANFSVIFDPRRRLPAVSAANLDREKRVVLPRQASAFVPDPRLPRDVQADPDWFKSPQIDYGHLTTRQEISWGPLFSDDDPDAVRRLADSVNVLTNVAPQFDTFNRFLWARLEQWILAEHNKDATRVSIFTGPVIAADDPVIDGAPMPRRFFKIAVSARSPINKALVVDAFVIAQFVDGTNDKITRTDFTPARFRVTIADIERATRLDFGDALRNASTSDAPDPTRTVSESQRPAGTVYFQFAGMSRDNATKISAWLQGLGWNIPGEERTGAAANQNEVRYGTESAKPAADKLVADLKTFGLKQVAAKLTPTLKQGPLEVWVSQ